ncbi:MAG: phosphoribosyltransferase [Desulfonatronovibrio sp.]
MKAEIHEMKNFRDERHVFRDREDAGKMLAMMLQPEYPLPNGLMVLAIPSGGVPVGLIVSKTLNLPFDLLIARKLKIPDNPEAGFGAMAQDGTTFLNERLLSRLSLSEAQIEDEKKRVGRELKKRNALFRHDRPFPALAGKKVILVDDGLASGFTMLACVDMVKKAGAVKIIVAVPTAPQRTIEHISTEVDKIYCLNIRTTQYFAVAEAYRHWYDLDEQEVTEMLEA